MTVTDNHGATVGTSFSGGGSEGEETPAPAPTTSTSGRVTESVNDTVGNVDQAVTGGALESAGVTQVTEEVVNGVAGPESTVGKVLDETVNAVGGILGGGKR